MAREAAGTKKQRDQLRAAMHDQGCTPEQIAAEMARQFGFRARQAWRHTHGWTQDEVAAAYNRLLDHDQAPMTGKRISDYEAWPHGGVKPTINTLAMLAKIYSTSVSNIVDLDDRKALNTQELIALDTHKTPPATPELPDSPHPDNNAAHLTTTGDRTTLPEPDTSTTIRQPDHTLEATPPSQHRRWHLILVSLLAITAVIGGAIITREITTDSQPPMHARAFAPSTAASSPSTPSMPPSVSPLSTAPTPPPLPAQVVLTPHQLPMPLSPPARAVPAPHQSPLPLSLPAQAAPAPPTQTTPSSPVPATQQASPPVQPLLSPEQPPPSTEPPTADIASAPTTAVTWKNMHYDMCLDEQESDVIHDPANIELWDCNNANNQIWTEKTIAANPTSIAKNLVSARSGRCVTYQPGDYTDRAKVWLTPCGKEGQGWIRHWNGAAYIFESAEIHGMCMSATSGPVTGGFIGIQLRRCDTPSPLKDWRLY